MKKFNLLAIFVLLVGLFSSALSASASSQLTSEEKGEIIFSAVFYDAKTDAFTVDSEWMVEEGLSREEADAVGQYFKDKHASQVAADFGVDAKVFSNGKHQGILPILIPIAQYLGGAVGAAIIYEVTVYGIEKACKKLKGQYDFFTDFCKTRDYI